METWLKTKPNKEGCGEASTNPSNLLSSHTLCDALMQTSLGKQTTSLLRVSLSSRLCSGRSILVSTEGQSLHLAPQIEPSHPTPS